MSNACVVSQIRQQVFGYLLLLSQTFSLPNPSLHAACRMRLGLPPFDDIKTVSVELRPLTHFTSLLVIISVPLLLLDMTILTMSS
jgi:hypothetical protein